jgi:hypothetical protein
MSETELRRMFDQASRFCEAHFATYGEISPMWHAVTSSDETIIEPHPIYLVDKDIAMALVRAFFDARDVVRYVNIGEAWTLTLCSQTTRRRKATSSASPTSMRTAAGFC